MAISRILDASNVVYYIVCNIIFHLSKVFSANQSCSAIHFCVIIIMISEGAIQEKQPMRVRLMIIAVFTTY